MLEMIKNIAPCNECTTMEFMVVILIFVGMIVSLKYVLATEIYS